MRILITTGIFPPDSGGPATYAVNIAKRLAERGHTVTVVTMADKKAYPEDGSWDFTLTRIRRTHKISNYLRYLWALIGPVRQADVVYTLNYFSYGFVTALVSKLCNTPYAVRVGGGYLWEHFYLYDNEPIPLAEFYKRKLYTRYPVGFRLLRFVLGKSEKVIFNSTRQAQLYKQPYQLKDDQITVVNNPTPDNEFAVERERANKKVVYAGRLTPMKNVSALVQAFAQANLPEYTLVIIGDGPTKEKLQDLARECGIADRTEFTSSSPQDKLFARITDARLVVLPSWTDISPNLVFECLSLDIPVLVTRENYLPFRDELPKMIDPGSIADIANKLSLLTRDDQAYNAFVDAFTSISFTQSWADITDTHEQLFAEMTD